MAGRKSSQCSLLWSVINKEGEASYLFGTMHVRSHTAHQFLSGVLPYIAGTQIFAAEMNLQQFDLKTMQESTTLSVEEGWYRHIKAQKFDKTRIALLKSFGIDLIHYKDRHPFLIMSAISESLLAIDNMASLDQELWNQADKMGRTCTGLESFFEQMDIMRRISVHDAFKQIFEISRNPGQFRKAMKKMISYYVSQDVNRLYKASRRQLQGLRKIMLFNRNERMVNRMEDLMFKETVFAGVGAAHLAGKQGMLSLLKKRGYKIRSMKINGRI
ncbi:MAG: TraB/GumN family protein [Saprospiraceae bacterium]|nr:TraB/GumN family protein [Saprospiraceae bacterium]